MKKIIFLLSIFLSFTGLKAQVTDNGESGVAFNVNMPCIVGFVDNSGASVNELKFDITANTKSFSIQYSELADDAPTDAVRLQNGFNAALQNAGASATVISVNTITKTITFKTVTPKDGQSIYFKISSNRTSKLRSVSSFSSSSLEILSISPNIVEYPNEVVTILMDELEEGQTYILRRYKVDGSYQDEEYFYHSSYLLMGNILK